VTGPGEFDPGALRAKSIQYRARAVYLRARASRFRDSTTQTTFLLLAREYETMSAQLEKIARQRSKL
jgi:hypothetical protein